MLATSDAASRLPIPALPANSNEPPENSENPLKIRCTVFKRFNFIN